MEIHRHPALTRMWSPVGQQPEVPAPGKNEKKVVYGGVDYRTGQLTYRLADTKCGGSFLVFLMALLLAYAGRKPLVSSAVYFFPFLVGSRAPCTLSHLDHVPGCLISPVAP